MRLPHLAIALLIVTGCKSEFDEYQENPIAGTWNLVSVEGVPGCTVTDGRLQVFDIEDTPLAGNFYWMAECDAGDPISEAGDIQAIETHVWGDDYGVDILLDTPSVRALDWDCSMSEPELNCIESGDTVIIFEFTRANAT